MQYLTIKALREDLLSKYNANIHYCGLTYLLIVILASLSSWSVQAIKNGFSPCRLAWYMALADVKIKHFLIRCQVFVGASGISGHPTLQCCCVGFTRSMVMYITISHGVNRAQLPGTCLPSTRGRRVRKAGPLEG